MNRIETFGFPQTHVQRFHRAQLETSIVDSLNYVTSVARAHCVGFDDSECKVAHPALLLVSSFDIGRGCARINADMKPQNQILTALISFSSDPRKPALNPRLNLYAAARAASASFIPLPMSAGDLTT